MPEGPECSITADLIDTLRNKVLIDISFVSGRYSETPPENFKKFKLCLPMKLEYADCKGKMIYVKFCNRNDDMFLVSNLGLSGRWYIADKDNVYNYGKPKAILTFKHGSKETFLCYEDTIAYGIIRFVYSSEMDELIDKLGPDVLRDDISLDEFKKIIFLKRNINKAIVEVLSDQKNISGIGNYLRSEILYSAKINPFRTPKSLTDAEIAKIKKYAFEFPRRVYQKEGSRNYVENGTFEFRIYKQKEDPNGNVVHKKKIKNQYVYYVDAQI